MIENRLGKLYDRRSDIQTFYMERVYTARMTLTRQECLLVHIHLWIYTTPYSFITAILCKYTKYTIITYTYTNTTYIHTASYITHTQVFTHVYAVQYTSCIHTRSQHNKLDWHTYKLWNVRACVVASHHIISYSHTPDVSNKNQHHMS